MSAPTQPSAGAILDIVSEIETTLGALSLKLNTLRIAHQDHAKSLSQLAVALAEAESVAGNISAAQYRAKAATMKRPVGLWYSRAENHFILSHRSPGRGYQDILRIWPCVPVERGELDIRMAVEDPFGILQS